MRISKVKLRFHVFPTLFWPILMTAFLHTSIGRAQNETPPGFGAKNELAQVSELGKADKPMFVQSNSEPPFSHHLLGDSPPPSFPADFESARLADYSYESCILIGRIKQLNRIKENYQIVMELEDRTSHNMKRAAEFQTKYPYSKLGKHFRSSIERRLSAKFGNKASIGNLSDLELLREHARVCANEADRLRASIANVERAIADLTLKDNGRKTGSGAEFKLK